MPEVITNNLDLWSSALLTRSTAGRGSNGKLEAYGIKKLRELILELAVRGKLVPQDANDEPASVLLENIAKEKARLIKEGVIKNEKALLPISNEEIPFDVPGEWVWQRLGEIGFTQTGGTPSKTNKDYFGNDIPFIKPGDIYPGYVDYDNEGLSNEGAKALGRTAPAGSILMVCIGTIGKCNMIERTCAFNQQINSITPYMEMSSFLLNALGSVYFQKTAWERSSSTTIAILNKGKWVDIVVPIPPLDEQYRIVAKVDELMALCDQLEQQQTYSIEAHQALVEALLGTLTRVESQQEFSATWARIASHFDTLFTTEASIDQLKKTILQLAVMGKLVPQDPNDEPATNLCEPDEELGNQSALDIPHGWAWARLSKLADINGGFAFKSTDYKEDGMRVVRISDFDEFGFKDHKVVRHPFTSELSRFCLGQNNILMAMTGGTVGKSYLVKSLPEPMIVNQRVATIKISECANPSYVDIVIRSEITQEVIQKAKNSTNDNISMGDIKGFAIPLPPLAEQQRIVAKVDELLALCDTLKARLADAQTTQLHLADAIVEQAVN